MTVRKFLDLSTAHLSPAAKDWLRESAYLNHEGNCGVFGQGAALGTLGATLYGWFMHAPELPETGGMDHGIPEDMWPIIRYAHEEGCHAILFDSDAVILQELPVLDGEDD